MVSLISFTAVCMFTAAKASSRTMRTQIHHLKYGIRWKFSRQSRHLTWPEYKLFEDLYTVAEGAAAIKIMTEYLQISSITGEVYHCKQRASTTSVRNQENIPTYQHPEQETQPRRRIHEFSEEIRRHDQEEIMMSHIQSQQTNIQQADEESRRYMSAANPTVTYNEKWM